MSLALSDWVRPVAYCESDRYSQSVLLSKMRRNHIRYAPIWTDVRTLRREHIDVPVDIIYGGFPCQDISVAGTGKGLAGSRSILVFQVFRLIDEISPSFIFLENVPAIRTRGAEMVTKELASRGYDCRWQVISAKEVGAPHLRKRWFSLAYRNVRLSWNKIKEIQARWNAINTSRKSLSDAQGVGSWKRTEPSKGPQQQDYFMRANWWEVEPTVGRVADGVPHRVDRIRGLGNAVVPLQAKIAFERLMGL